MRIPANIRIADRRRVARRKERRHKMSVAMPICAESPFSACNRPHAVDAAPTLPRSETDLWLSERQDHWCVAELCLPETMEPNPVDPRDRRGK